MKNYKLTLAIIYIFCIQVYSQTWSSMGNGIDYPVNSIVYSNGSIYAGADLVYQWNGSSWTAVSSGMNGLFGVTEINAMAVNNNILYAGGTFFVLTPDQNWYNYAAKLYNGSWITCGSGLNNDGWGMNDIPLTMISYGGDLYAGGNFTEAGGDPLNPHTAMYIARFDGSYWNPVGSGVNEHITDMTVFNNQLIVSGYFTNAGGTNANYIAAWDGNSWHSLGSGMSSDNIVKVTALAVHKGYLYAGGLFDTAGGAAATNIAKWDGVIWSPVGDGLNGQVYALASYNGNLYAGGNFNTNTGGPGNYIAKWDGEQWSNVGVGLDGPVFFFLVEDNKLYTGGNFITAGDQPAKNIAIWSDNTASVKNSSTLPDKFYLSQNFPNPFNPSTIISWQTAVSSRQTLKIFDVLGREITTLLDEEKPAGTYEVVWNATNLPTSIYFYQLKAGSFTATKRLLLLK